MTDHDLRRQDDQADEPARDPDDVGASARATRDPWWDLVRIAALALAAVALSIMVGRVVQVLGLVALAGAFALLTQPVRRRLARFLPDGAAIALTALLTFVLVLVVGGLVAREIGLRAGRVADDLTAWIDGFRPGTLPDRIAGALDAQGGVDAVFGRLPTMLVAGEEDSIGVARRVIDLLLAVILAAFFQSTAARAIDALARRWPRRARADVRSHVDDVVGRGLVTIRRSALLALVVWTVVGAVAALLDLPSPVLIGLWAAVWSFVPWVGAWVGAAPFVVTAALAEPVVFAVSIVVSVLVGVGTGVVRRRWVESRGVHLGAFAGVLALATGWNLGGTGGAVVALVVAALVVSALTSEHRFVRPGDVEPDPADGEEPIEPGPAGTNALVRVADGRVLLAPGRRGALVLLGTVTVATLVWLAVGMLHENILWLIVALLIAIALHRPMAFIERRTGAPRAVSLGVVATVGLAVAAAAVALGATGGAASSEQLSSELPTVVEDLETLPVVGPWLAERDAAVWVEEQMANLPQRLDDAQDVADWLPTVGSGLLSLFWVMTLTVALLVDGPRLVDGAHRRIPAVRRRQAVRLTQVSHAAIGGYLAGAAMVAGLNATVVLIIGFGVGIALAPVLAVWAFIWNFVPQIGGFMGGFPLVVLALAEGPVRAVIAGLAFVSYQFVENHLIQPAVIGEAIDVPAWVALLGALAGGAAAGVVGAVVLTPLVGVVRVIIAETRRADFPGATVTVAPEPDPPPPDASSTPPATGSTGPAPAAALP